MNMSNPDHAFTLSAAVNGHLRLGSITQNIAEANDAARVGAKVIDGLAGDDNFPNGDIKPLYTVGEINMCEENHGDVVSVKSDRRAALPCPFASIIIIVPHTVIVCALSYIHHHMMLHRRLLFVSVSILT